MNSNENMTLKDVQEYVKQNNAYIKKNGGNSKISEDTNNAIIKGTDGGLYANDLSEKVADIDARSTVGKVNAYCELHPSESQTMAKDLIIKFDTIFANKGFDIDLINCSVYLKKGKVYEINPYVYTSVTGYTSYYIYNKTKNVIINNRKYSTYISISVNSNDSSGESSIGKSTIYECNEDCEIQIKVDVVSGAQKSLEYLSSLVIKEIGSTILLDPVKYAQEHEVVSGSFKLADTVPPNAGNYLKFTDRINGNFEMNEDGTFTLKKDTTYDISIGILAVSSMIQVQLYDITNSRLFGNIMDCVPPNSNYNFNTLPNINTQITPTSDILVGAKVTVSSNTSLLNTNICYFNITEIKNPVVVEYTNLKEISNPLMSSQISQEAPIGTIIKYIGGNIPNYYLPCDGKIYLITDHLALFNVIGNEFGGDGITTFAVPNYTETPVDVTPIMTSNTAPSPYVASASSVYNNETRYYPYRAFNGTNVDINDAWLSAGIATPQYIMLDFGTPTTVNEVKMIANNSTASPKDFTVQGSNDGSSFTIIKTFSETSWVNNVAKTLSLGTSVTYRYFKVNITSNNGNSSYVGIGQLRFLNSATKDYIKSEATHYAVNQYGGFMMDTLWEGNALNNTTFILADSYKNYDIIYICCSYNNSFLGSSPFSVLSIKQGDYLCVDVPSIASTYADNTGRVRILSETSMTLTNATNISIYKILGIKGSIPTIIEGGVL